MNNGNTEAKELKMAGNKFTKWLEIFLEEKGTDLDRAIEVEVEGTVHYMTSGVVVEHMMVASAQEQAGIKNILVMIDFKNGSVDHFINHLAEGLAVQHGKVA